MPKLIKNRAVVADEWVLVREPEELVDLTSQIGKKLIVPLSVWQERKEQLLARVSKTAVWLNSNELPEQLAIDLPQLELVALNFPVFSDGRAYSSARELRASFAYEGEIRAIGDVLIDQLFYMRRCGFDAFDLRDDQNIERALEAFDDFQEGYQSSVDRPVPLFRRRA